MTASGAVYPGSNPGGAIMKLLLEIRDEDIGLDSKKTEMKKREAARAVMLNGKKIAILNVSKADYHKLPGGGLEGSESIEEALFREIKEETGCKIRIVAELGKIVEHRTHLSTLQTSYCFVAKVLETGKPEFDAGEKEAGYELEWMRMDSALAAMEKEDPEDYVDKFILLRDTTFLRAARDFIRLRAI
jgi:8-oxo-dGTP diphosphatase